MKSESGLTLVELLVSSAIMLAVFAMVFTAFLQARQISIRTQMDAENVQNARIGLDEMVRTLRMLGYGRDTQHGQAALIEAAPFQIIFNADIYASRDALPPESSIPLYDATNYFTPMQNYTTGAETFRWTLDTNDDGLVDQRDTNDDEEERATGWNPNDMVLNREINGRDAQVTMGVLGPYDANDRPTHISPMFQYWLREPDGSFALLGDKNGDKQLTGEELYFRSMTSHRILKNIRRVQVTLTVESDQYDPFGKKAHRRTTLSSGVSLRNYGKENADWAD